MKLIVISNPENIPNETERVSALFENGLEIFHVHKPNSSDLEIQNYIQQFLRIELSISYILEASMTSLFRRLVFIL